MGLLGDLRALAAALAPEEEQHGDPGTPSVTLCPLLRSTYQPRGFAPPREVREGPGKHLPWPSGLGPWDPSATAEGGEHPGFIYGAKSETGPQRYGLRGMPGPARKKVSRALACLEENRKLLSFWTVTLTDQDLNGIALAGSLDLFQDRLRKELLRQLRRHGLPQAVVGVVELQPKRSARDGRPAPHFHVVFQGKRRRDKTWRLSTEVLDRVILSALGSAFQTVTQAGNRGNVQGVRKSVRAYLAKYLTKGSSDVSRYRGYWAERLIPRQWWFMTRELLALVLRHVTPVLAGFIRFVHDQRADLEIAGLCRVRKLDLKDPRAPATWEANFISPRHLSQLLIVWAEEEWQDQWEKDQRIARGCPHLV